ncbi:MAG: TaqI-like C-terminal specificity domain-containing protein [Kiritimatiellales bacterium]
MLKQFHELLLYYLRERITNNNLELRHLIVTNVYEWFIFDAQVFEQCFAKNKELVHLFRSFDDGQLSGTKTDWFYKEIAPRFIDAVLGDICFTHIDFRSVDQANDAKLLPLFKILSPAHLLKLPFVNDSNTLDKKFYTELLHIIGLTERREKGKKLIERKPENERDTGSLLENAIVHLDSLDKTSRLEKPQRFGANTEERLFNVALELAITWTNRILFLKLLEAQLIAYHKGDRKHAFLNKEKIRNYDDLNSLFFEVLARIPPERRSEMNARFDRVPYLNSSLFEPAAIEHAGLFISQIKDRPLPVLSATVLKDRKGRKRTGELDALEYFFDFLDAYDFTSEGSAEIQEESKTLINAAVLGLIFEKINGYKDGSFFTPGFITMYMCRETIRRAVIQKFNQEKGWSCVTVDELVERIDDNADANRIINSLKICDPAVGSGHFLVSALNEIIALKSEMGILCDRAGKRLKNIHVEVVNDELFVTDEDGEFFDYKPKLPDSQRIQEALFHEKETIIENCLFGVDINPNSVKICRLRLWIELLKNAYYKTENELETLPNIDINIKCGNSLISRFALDSDLKKALKKGKWTIDTYRLAVKNYRNAKNKEQKREFEKLIDDIKSNFEAEIYANDPRMVRLRKERGKLFELTNQTQMFELSKKEKADWNKKVKEHTAVIETLEAEIEAIKSNRIYENAFEWRFEFPEALDDDGNFIGFDIMIGNPPYVYRNSEVASLKEYFKTNYYNVSGNFDLYKFFIERGVALNSIKGISSFITNSSFLLQTSFEKSRQFILEKTKFIMLTPLGPKVFEEATVDSAIYVIQKIQESNPQIMIVVPPTPLAINSADKYYISQERFKNNDSYVFDYLLENCDYKLVKRLLDSFPNIETGFEFGVGINTGYIKSELTSSKKIDDRYHLMITGTGIQRYAPPNSNGYIMYDREFVKSKGSRGRTLPEEKFFTDPKILIVRTRNLSIKQRIVATIDYEQKYNLNRISNIIARKGFKLEGLLGVLNSSLFNWLYLNRYFDYEIKPVYLRKSPLCDVNNKKLNQLVVKILKIKKKNPDADVSAFEAEIDQIVYKLYGLTEDEVKIVEDAKV